ncbi:MAG: hypothetical protein H8E26_07030 [FCB group bacterium]|nr:hypothetical protein [FCB group bacterium]MBL7027135.1 hypothetical protein [Candidatus Neomarinimicrobiota bacterium]MBL7120630.1 hypothetical protein [Candidatus Neomarinimicrobiota bacterium]
MSHPTKILLLILLALSLTGQDLNSAWQAYMSTNASIAELEARRSSYTQEQIEIKSDVDELQKSSDWYNAWINKFLLSGLSKRQLVILDSLRVFDTELERLRTLQKSEIRDLKFAYENVLQDYEKAGVIPAEQGLRNMQFGRWKRVVDRSSPILFPDYTDVLNLQLRNPEQRKIILMDIQRLLQVKIMELDSIRNVREEEAELALRLASFHDDLGLQMEADPDAQQRDASGNTDKRLGWITTAPSSEFAANDVTEDGGRDMASGLSSEAIDLININAPGEEVGEMSLDQRSGQDLNYLKKKLVEYQVLLDQINQELDQ